MSRRIVAFEGSVIVAATAAALVAYPHLPSDIPTHWGVDLQPNGYSDRAAIFALGPGLLLAALMAAHLLPRMSPASYRVETFGGTWQRLMLLLFCLLACCFGLVLWSALGHSFNVVRWMAGTLSVFLVLFGNLLGKVRPNFFLGIRTPWTLASDAVWIATHRAAAWLTVLSGLLGLALVLIGRTQWFIVPFVLAEAAAVMYSYVLDRRVLTPIA